MQPPPPPPLPETLPSHSLVAGIFGVYCTKCNQSVKKKGNLLDVPDAKTIRRHLKSCVCYSGGTKPPNAVNIERELITSQDAIHSAVKNNPQLAADKIALIFPDGTTPEHKAYVCNKCGYSSKRKNLFVTHFGAGNVYGCHLETDASSEKVHVCEGKYGITCPKHFFTLVQEGCYIRPKKKPRISPQHQMPNRAGTTPSAAVNNNNASPQHQRQQPASNTSTPLSSTPFHPILKTSLPTMSRVKEGTPFNQLKVNSEARIDRALSVFVDPSSTNAGDSTNIAFVKKHLPLVLKVIDVIDTSGSASPDLFFRNLVSKTSTTQLQNDHGSLKVIKLAGNQWLKSAANYDVPHISPGHRGRLFQVSEPEAPDAETMVSGKTFVPSKNIDNIVTVWNHFIHFICRHNPTLIRVQLNEALDIYNAKIERHEKEKDALADAAQEIVQTNILFGIILAAIHEQPQSANGMNSLDYFLVASSILAPTNNRLKFLAGGGIGEYFVDPLFFCIATHPLLTCPSLS